MKRLQTYISIVILIIILALCVVYYKYDPSASLIFPKCPVMSLTGLPCAGCGSQRAIHALLNLDIAAAVRYNFLIVLFIPIIALLLFTSVFRNRFPKLYLYTHHPYVIYAMLVIIILWWIMRIVFGWYV